MKESKTNQRKPDDVKIMASEYKVVPGSVSVPTFLVVNCYNQSFEDDRILVPNVKFRVPGMSVPVPPVVDDMVKTVNNDPDLGTYILTVSYSQYIWI